MSGFAGVFMRSGEPADLDAVQRMAHAARYRGAKGSWRWSSGPFAAVQQWTSVASQQLDPPPAPATEESFVLLFDGRIDNRDELIPALGGRRTDSDASLVRQAWIAWREDAAHRIIGDFAFVVWDDVDRSVFCARDAMGIRPLFYCLTDRELVFGSEVRQVLTHPCVPQSPDEEMIAGLLAGWLPRTNARTLYDGIRCLPHGHTLRVTRAAARRTRYWCVDLGHELKLANDMEYAEAFREVFDRAVAARIADGQPVAAYLSGGLDSSSVVATTRAVGGAARSVTTFSLVFPGVPAADEREYSEAVVRHVNVEGVWLRPRGLDLCTGCAQVAGRRELPDYPHDYAGEAVRRAMLDRGLCVALSGSGGDVGLSGSHYHYADLLRRGRFVALFRRYLDVARQPSMHWFQADLLRCAAWPVLPVAARRALRPVTRRAAGAGAAPVWIAPQFARRVSHFDRPPVRQVPGGRLARADVLDGFDNGWTHMAMDRYQRGSAECGIEERHPFYDRRVIEFALSLPDEQRWQGGRTRYVLRNALSGRLPDVVRDRLDAGKGDLSHLYVQALVAIGGRGFFADSLDVAERGWVVAAEARQLYDRMRAQHARQDIACGDSAFRLWNIAALELWHRGVFGPRAGRSSWIDQIAQNCAQTGPQQANASLTGVPF